MKLILYYPSFTFPLVVTLALAIAALNRLRALAGLQQWRVRDIVCLAAAAYCLTDRDSYYPFYFPEIL